MFNFENLETVGKFWLILISFTMATGRGKLIAANGVSVPQER